MRLSCTLLFLVLAFSFSYSISSHSSTSFSTQEAFSNSGIYVYKHFPIQTHQYKALYKAFDTFMEVFEHNSSLRLQMASMDKSFAYNLRSKYFANAPMGYRYYKNHFKLNKDYYHFSPEYYEFVKKYYPQTLEQFPALSDLLIELEKVDQISRDVLEQSLEGYDETMRSQIKQALYKDRDSLTLITKVVKYKPSEKPASHAHYDFSGLTIIIDNDDEQESYLELGARDEKGHVVFQKNAFHKQPNQALFLPGIGLQLEGIDIKPTPHRVAPIQKDRHALMVFAMVPYKHIDYRQIRLTEAHK